MFLGADRDFAELADDRLVAFVARMHRNRAVAEHRFGARGGDGDIVARLLFERDIAIGVALDISIGFAARERIFEVPHMAVHFARFDLEVGDRGLEMRVPVDEALVAVEQALIVEIDEHLDDGL